MTTEVPSLHVVTSDPPPPMRPKSNSSSDRPSSPDGKGGNGTHLCTQGYQFERLNHMVGSIMNNVNRLENGFIQSGLKHDQQLGDLKEQIDKVLTEVLSIGYRVGRVGNDPTSEAEATGLTKALLSSTHKVMELQKRIDEAFTHIDSLKKDDEVTGVHNLQEKYRDAKVQIRKLESKIDKKIEAEEKRQEDWRKNVAKILVLLIAGGSGAEAVKYLIHLLTH